MTELAEYYSKRAGEYEAIYHRDDPMRQGELAEMAAQIEKTCSGKRVLEIACGTGFWTAKIARCCPAITACDISTEVLEVARAKQLGAACTFVEADAFNLAAIPGEFEAGLNVFWFSHIPRRRVQEFLRGFHQKLKPGAPIFLADNVHVEGVGGELIRKTGEEDTFKLRTLADGSRHEVLKNYFTAAELRGLLEPVTRDLVVHIGRCYWWGTYRTPE